MTPVRLVGQSPTRNTQIETLSGHISMTRMGFKPKNLSVRAAGDSPCLRLHWPL
jgi:hypothetical protein